MTFNEYQSRALATAIYPDRGTNLSYPALKLGGECGEVQELIGKAIRDEGYTVGQVGLSPERTQKLIKELGDVLWYLAALAGELGTSLDEIAEKNLEKLADRKARGVLTGSGSDR